MATLRHLLPQAGLLLCLVLHLSSAIPSNHTDPCAVFDKVIISFDNLQIQTKVDVLGNITTYTLWIPVNNNVSAVILRAVNSNNNPMGNWTTPDKECKDGHVLYQLNDLKSSFFTTSLIVPTSENTTEVSLQVFIVDHNHEATFFSLKLNQEMKLVHMTAVPETKPITLKAAKVTPRKPTAMTTRKATRVTPHKPTAMTTRKPTRVTPHKPTAMTTRRAAGMTTHKPTAMTTRRAAGMTTHKPTAMTTRRAAGMTTHKPIVMTTRKAAGTTPRPPIVTTTHKATGMTTRKPIVTTTSKTNAVTTSKATPEVTISKGTSVVTTSKATPEVTISKGTGVVTTSKATPEVTISKGTGVVTTSKATGKTISRTTTKTSKNLAVSAFSSPIATAIHILLVFLISQLLF